MSIPSIEYSPKKRLLSAILSGRVDRIPVTAVCQTATFDQMTALGINWSDAHTDPQKMSNLAKAAYEYTGLETVKVPFDQAVEAEALGAQMELKGWLPTITRHAFEKFMDFKVPEDWLNRKRIPVVVESVRMIREDVGHVLPVIASVVGPLTLSTMIYGNERTLKGMLREANETAYAISSLVDPLACYARKLVGYGADILVIEDMFALAYFWHMKRLKAISPIEMPDPIRDDTLEVSHAKGSFKVHLTTFPIGRGFQTI